MKDNLPAARRIGYVIVQGYRVSYKELKVAILGPIHIEIVETKKEEFTATYQPSRRGAIGVPITSIDGVEIRGPIDQVLTQVAGRFEKLIACEWATAAGEETTPPALIATRFK